MSHTAIPALALLTFALLSTVLLPAQVRVGLSAGVIAAESRLTFSRDAATPLASSSIPGDRRTSFTLGIPVDVPVTERFGIEMGLHYLTQGLGFPFTDEIGSPLPEEEDVFHVLELPALLRYREAVGSWAFDGLLGAGAQYVVRRSPVLERTDVNGRPADPAAVPWRDFGVAAQAGLRVAYALPVGEVGLTDRYRHQVTNSFESDVSALRFASATVSAGYTISL